MAVQIKYISQIEAALPFVYGLALAWFISSSLTGSGKLHPVANPVFSAPQSEGISTSVIKERNILGLENPLPKAAVSGPDPSSWKLLGIIASSRPMVLLLAEGKTKTVKLHENESGWTLETIDSNSASFKSGSQERVLTLFKATTTAVLTKGGKNKVSLAKAEVAPVLQDPGNLLQQALFKPNLNGGKTEGYRIDNIQNNSILNRLGFKNGDILLRINGEAIDGPAKMMQLYSGLQAAQAVNMDIKRGNELISMVVELN